jgi:YhgE/Pip-like protein
MKNFKSLIYILSVVALLCGGLILGIMLQEQRIAAANAVNERARTTIAIVNMDMGVKYNGEDVNYADAFVGSLTGDFALVSAQTAEVGLKNGIYGGIITIPADLSEKVVSINAENPQQVTLSYVINNRLSSDKYVEVFLGISDAQSTLRSVLSYVYMVSIFDEIHYGQESVSNVEENDRKDLDAVNKLKTTRFMEGLKIKEMPIVMPEFEEYDLTEFLQLTSDYAAAVDELYKTEYNNVKTAYKNSVSNTQASLSGIETAFNDWNTGAQTYITNFSNAVENDTAVASGTVTALNEYRTALNSYCRKLNNYKYELDTYLLKLEQYKTYLEEVSGESISDFGTYVSESDLSFDIPKKTSVSSPTELSQSDLPSGWQLPSVGIPPESPDTTALFDGLTAAVDSYNPDNFFTAESSTDVVQTLTVKLGENLTSKQMSLSAQASGNMQKLNMQAAEYASFITGMTADVTAKYYEDSEELQAALDAFYAQKQATTADNEEQLMRISALLPYSRKDGLINKAVVEFIIEPVGAKDTGYSVEGTTADGVTDAVLMWLLIGISGLCALAVAGLALAGWIRERRERSSVQEWEDSF